MLPSRRSLVALLSVVACAANPSQSVAAEPLNLGVGLFQPAKEKNDATYKPLAEYLAKALGREVRLRTVDTWEGRDAMIADGLIKASDSKIIWTSDPLPNDAFAVSAQLFKDKTLVIRL